MAKYAALMAMGRGLTAAGEGFDRRFQLQMEQMRQQSLKELESRKLDLMEQEINDNKAWRDESRSDARVAQFEDAKAKFDERMDKIAQQIVAQLPEGQGTEMMARVMKQLMSDPDALLGYYTDNELDGEKLGNAISTLTNSLEIPGTLDEDKAKQSIGRFAEAMVKDWDRLRKRYPELAPAMEVEDILATVPAFYGYTWPETEAETEAAPVRETFPAPPPVKKEPIGLRASRALSGVGESLMGAVKDSPDYMRDTPTTPSTLTPNQQRAFKLGFIDAQGNPTGVRQSVPGPGLMNPTVPQGYGPQLNGPLNLNYSDPLSKDPLDDLNQLR